MSKKLIQTLQNVALSTLVCVIFYALLEFVFFFYFLPHLPIRFYGYLPEPFSILAQSSKSKTIPTNYIALFGDSYALGVGDWLLEANDWTNPPFASQHVLHQKLKRDVVSFGRSAAGNTKGFVTTPKNVFRILNATWFYHLDPPKIILAYFYEGNDLEDNLIESKLKSFPESEVKFKQRHNLIFLRMIEKMVLQSQTEMNMDAYKAKLVALRLKGANHFLINGIDTLVPRSLQGPSLHLSDEQMRQGIGIFQKSLDELKEQFPETKIILVYIPSVLACYEINATQVSSHVEVFPAELVIKRSDWVERQIEQITKEAGLDFIDTRQALRETAKTKLIHGPIDWYHFNRIGYEIVGETIAVDPNFQNALAA